MEKMILAKKSYKKSQMEAFGLAMIVILLTLGLFIILVFKINAAQNKESVNKEYIYDELAVNFINTVINVDVKECYDNKRTLSELIRDCAKRSSTECNSIPACILVNQTIHELLNKSLIARRDSFNFRTDGLNWPHIDDEIEVINYNCTEEDPSGQMGAFPVSLYPEPRVVYLYLRICKR